MQAIKAIRTEAHYEAALARAADLMDAEANSPDADELDVLADLIEHYETKHIPISAPSAVAAVKFRMEQQGLANRDLIPFIGSSAKVSEVLSGKRAITMPMARALHQHLGIPAEVLLQEQRTTVDAGEWEKFPVKELIRRGWVKKKASIEQMMRDFMSGLPGESSALYRKNDYARANAKSDPYALSAWCIQVLREAEKRKLPRYKEGTVTVEFLGNVAKLSAAENGPLLAREFLAENGIALVTLRHLPRTHLDGAALRLSSGGPVVGLSLRYDRIDSFWFCLLHELAHIGQHMQKADEAESFVDDLKLDAASVGHRDRREAEADEWAIEALIPRIEWEASAIWQNPTTMNVSALASRLHIHPAIVAGRIRRETKNYRLLTHFVGTGLVQKQFKEWAEQ